jgi:DNA invertase Pin-like site-specific DNA recombinase
MMVLLCESCHAKVHDHSFLNHTALICAGIKAAKAKGVVLGRPVGSTVAPEVLLAAHKDIVKHLKAGQSIRNVATLTGKSTRTVQRVKGLMLQS